ncbi:MAG: RsmE family RNA methyltransferase [Terriglobales bacterium]
MTRRRWIADRWEGNRAFLTGNHAQHLARVLRARVGQEFDIATGDEVRLGRIVAISEEQVEFELGEAVARPDQGQVSLLLAVFKFDRMEWAIEKATELGVKSITPVICRRTDAHLATAAAKRVERWRRIAREAAEQSRRAAPPEIAEPVKLGEAIALRAEIRVVLSESEHARSLRGALEQRVTGETPVLRSAILAVGPEGGWTEDELRAFVEAGWTPASLGTTILRAETAAVAAVAIASALQVGPSLRDLGEEESR